MGKISGTFRGMGPVGLIAVSGAGDGPSIDGISKLLSSAFCADEDEEPPRMSALALQHQTYYKEHILPFADYPPDERPDYSLIIGCIGGGVGTSIFYTSKLAFNEAQHYEAVGIGASIANAWLSKLYELTPVVYTARLAAYVIYQVKNSVGGCGMGTDILILRPNRIFERISPEAIRKWEDIFRQYRALERNIFHYCAGVEVDDPRKLIRTSLAKEDIRSQLDELREAFRPSDAQTSKDQP
jgi:20S proteasome alpha/beta subunit